MLADEAAFDAVWTSAGFRLQVDPVDRLCLRLGRHAHKQNNAPLPIPPVSPSNRRNRTAGRRRWYWTASSGATKNPPAFPPGDSAQCNQLAAVWTSSYGNRFIARTPTRKLVFRTVKRIPRVVKLGGLETSLQALGAPTLASTPLVCASGLCDSNPTGEVLVCASCCKKTGPRSNCFAGQPA
jgi:hypothetical protein